MGQRRRSVICLDVINENMDAVLKLECRKDVNDKIFNGLCTLLAKFIQCLWIRSNSWQSFLLI